MKKEYPVIEGKYRFIGGWKDMPNTLMELSVGTGYVAQEAGEGDYLIRGGKKLIMVTESQLGKYFEPFVDYFAEPEIIGAAEETIDTSTHEDYSNFHTDDLTDTEMEQISLF